MIEPDPSRGHVLVLADEEERAERLAKWAAAAGHQPLIVVGAETFKMDSGDDEAFDLVATDLHGGDPAARALLARLLWGGLFRSVPQLHLLRDVEIHRQILARDPALADSLIAPPHEAETFATRARLSAEIGRLRRELSRRSIRDPLTGLFNRRYVYHRLDEEFSRARRYRTPLSFLLLDVDRLRDVNNEHGTAAGDAVIRAVAGLLQAWVRLEDVVGRCGDDSFGFVLPGNRFRGAAALANKMRTEVEELELGLDEGPVRVRVSAGVSTYPDGPDIDSADELARRAEAALAEAKTRGGNRVFIDTTVFRGPHHGVLVVDADPTLLEIVSEVLGGADLEVLAAAGPQETLEALDRAMPDLVVVEVETAGGAEAAARLVDRIRRERSEHRVPAIAVSRTGRTDPETLLRLGFDRFLTKPFSVSVLRVLAHELLRDGPARAGARDGR